MGRVRRVSERADMIRTLSFYADIQLGPNGMFSCPFHGEDKHPSAQVRGNRWRCYACGAHGDAIDFVAQFQGIDIPTAAKMIDQDFGLGVYDKELTPEEIKRQAKADRIRKERKSKREYYILRLKALGNRYRMALDRFNAAAPDSVKDLSADRCKDYASASVELESLTEEILRTEDLIASMPR